MARLNTPTAHLLYKLFKYLKSQNELAQSTILRAPTHDVLGEEDIKAAFGFGDRKSL